MPARHGSFPAACLLIVVSGCGRLGYETVASSANVRDASDVPQPHDGGSLLDVAMALQDANVTPTVDASAGYVDAAQTPGTLSRYLGTGTRGFDDGPAQTATLAQAFGLLLTPQGLYIADSVNAAIRLFKPNGQLETIIGSAGPGLQDGPRQNAKLRYPVSLAQDSQGRLLIADERNHAIRRLNLDGMVETIAGTGVAGFKDGPAAQAQFNSPRALLIDSTVIRRQR